jgi:hypothetical protein
MQLDDLTEADFDLLNEGLDAIKAMRRSGEAMGEMVGAMLCGRDIKMRDKVMRDAEARRAKELMTNRVNDERIILLKAKLVMHKQSLCAEKMLERR